MIRDTKSACRSVNYIRARRVGRRVSCAGGRVRRCARERHQRAAERGRRAPLARELIETLTRPDRLLPGTDERASIEDQLAIQAQLYI